LALLLHPWVLGRCGGHGGSKRLLKRVVDARSDILQYLGGIRSWAASVPLSGTNAAQIDGRDGFSLFAHP